MRNILLASAAALSMMLPATLSAQATGQPSSGASTASTSDKRPMTRDQQSMHDSWPAERQTMYSAMTPDLQEYYWTLMPDQQEAYWLLSNDQRMQIHSQTPEQRTATWGSIMSQVNAARTGNANASGAGMSSSMPSGSSGSAATTGRSTTGSMGSMNMPSSTGSATSPMSRNTTGAANSMSSAPPASAMNKDYPVCGGQVQDSCINPRGR